MAIRIDSQVVTATKVYRIRVTLTSITPITDPVAYVGQPEIWLEVLAIAGLPELLFIGASLVTQGYIGTERYYVLDMVFDQTAVTATGHSHDYTTLFMPLRESYRDGPYIDLDPTLGPVDIWSDTNSIDFLRVRRRDTATDYFYIKADGTIQLGNHVRFAQDAVSDIGSVDGGVTLRRPRDVYVGRNLLVGEDLIAGGSGLFGEQVEATHFRFTQQPSNPSTDPNVRHIYWNGTDNTLRGWDGANEFIIGGGSGTPTGITGIYDCPVAVTIGDVVCIDGSGMVNKAEAALLGLKPVVGICINKLLPTRAVVQLYGEVGVFAGSLIPDQLYFLGHAPGTLTNDPNSFAVGETVQLVGISKNSNTLTLRFESRMLL